MRKGGGAAPRTVHAVELDPAAGCEDAFSLALVRGLVVERERLRAAAHAGHRAAVAHVRLRAHADDSNNRFTWTSKLGN